MIERRVSIATVKVLLAFGCHLSSNFSAGSNINTRHESVAQALASLHTECAKTALTTLKFYDRVYQKNRQVLKIIYC